MSEFDRKAREWDKSMMHRERAETVAAEIIRRIPLEPSMKAMEFGAGTGLLSFNLAGHLGEITLIDKSAGMIEVLTEKIREGGLKNMHPLLADLDDGFQPEGQYDIIYTLMVLHHVEEPDRVLGRFSELIKRGGYLAISDIYSEDGSFHGEGFHGHKGFDAVELAAKLEKHGFSNVNQSTVYTINRATSTGETKQFEVFLMTAIKE